MYMSSEIHHKQREGVIAYASDIRALWAVFVTPDRAERGRAVPPVARAVERGQRGMVLTSSPLVVVISSCGLK
jgi:hypothetical protein